MWKRVFGYSILLLCALLLISCHPGPATETQTTEGLTVTAHAEMNDKFTNALGGSMWRFDVAAERSMLCDLEVQEEGKAAINLGGIGLAEDRKGIQKIQKTLMVAIVPMGKSLMEADQIKVVECWEGGSASNVVANPFRDASTLQYTSPSLQADGTWRLFQVTKRIPQTASEASASRRVTLVCRFSHHPADAKFPRP